MLYRIVMQVSQPRVLVKTMRPALYSDPKKNHLMSWMQDSRFDLALQH